MIALESMRHYATYAAYPADLVALALEDYFRRYLNDVNEISVDNTNVI